VPFRYLTLNDLEVSGKRVLVRADLNVPLDNGTVTDDFRISSALGTIQQLRTAGAVVAVCSHLGRPKGVDPAFRMDPVARRLGELGGFGAVKLDSVAGPEVAAKVAAAVPGDVLVLENTRFEPGETKNDPELAERLAGPFDLFVEDAFGSVHRAHASTVGVAERIKSVAGPLLDAEIDGLGRFLGEPARPYLVVLGGAKISDKLGVINHLLPKVDRMLIGGGMCFTLMAARGVPIGSSLVEESMLDEVKAILEGPFGDRIELPADVVIADRFAADANHRLVASDAIPDGWMGLDIGPATVARFSELIAGAASVFWNGPMGVFEWEPFRSGTEQVAHALAASSAFSAVGGGDSASALRTLGLADRVSHLSTGGGAGLELLEGRDLPGVSVLERWC
jgi:phosphoglycerate kinase